MKEFVIPNEIKTVLDRLCQNGFSAYIVGGCVRDILMDTEPHDYDVTTSSTPEQTLEVFKDFRTYELGRKFGTITVVSGEYHVEITTMRTEKGYADGRRPDEVIFTDSIMEDASRRDFTINAMAYSLKDGFFDGFGGAEDIENKLIKAVGDAEVRFKEDGLRIMRALRFAARLGFEIEENTEKVIRKCLFMLDNIAKERIRDELDRLLVCRYSAYIIDRYFDVFCYIIPQLENIRKEEMLSFFADTQNDRLLKLSALLLQTGDCVKDILRNLKYSNDDIDTVTKITENYCKNLETDADLRRMMNKIGYENTKSILILKHQEGMLVRLENMKNHPYSMKSLAVNGNDVAKLGMKGSEIGRILNILLEEVINDPSKNTKEQLILHIKSLIE